jgi:hypothetical protein
MDQFNKGAEGANLNRLRSEAPTARTLYLS